jgi:DNA-binding transcriptional LysR family regulator
VLIPKLKKIAGDYPDVQVEVTAYSGMVDIAERFDAGVRFGSRVADGMIAVRLVQMSNGGNSNTSIF